MKLSEFRVYNYRSIKDSGPVTVDRITALVGRNESGKSNLLRALHSLNPADGFGPLNKKKDFPRHRRLSECEDDTLALSTVWELTPEEQANLETEFPRAKGVKSVTILRFYGNLRTVELKELSPLPFDARKIFINGKTLQPHLQVMLEHTAPAQQSGFDGAIRGFVESCNIKKPYPWAAAGAQAIQDLKKEIVKAGARLNDPEQKALDEMEYLANQIIGEAAGQAAAEKWIIANLPVFVFLDEYPSLPGYIDIGAHLRRTGANPPAAEDSDRQFAKLCKVAGLSPRELAELQAKKDAETRNLLANRASAVVTNELRRLWQDRKLKVRFNVDGDYFETLVSDPTDAYDVEVNLNERSRGFAWFFSFYITFAADTQGGNAEKAILLLDEPGLYLHALSQDDLLTHFESDFSNQIIYSTHSPFMIPPRTLPWIRTVNISEESQTTVTDEPTGDPKTLFPLQSALGYSAAQSLFISEKNVVVEGVTDFWILSSVSEYLKTVGTTSLMDRAVITPGGGAQRASYMVALLTSQSLEVVLLLDDEAGSRDEKERMVRERLIREENVVFVTDAFETDKPSEADIEDLIGADVYEALVRESYSRELAGKTLTLNASVPRVVKRVEQAFEALEIPFHKSRPANLFMRKIVTNPKEVLPTATASRFESLFLILNQKLERLAKSGRRPFGAAR